MGAPVPRNDVNNREMPGRAVPRVWKSTSTKKRVNGDHDVIRILIADDHALLRDGLRKLLESEEDLRVVGEAHNCEEAVRLAHQLRPNILLLSLGMSENSALEVLRQLAAISVPVQTIVLAGFMERAQIVEALRLGARGIVQKESGTQLLLEGIRNVVAGQLWLERKSVSELAEALGQLSPRGENEVTSRFGLTSREMEIVGAIVSGDTNKEIAQKFSLGERTVKHHLTNIFNKLGVGSRLELALFAINRRLVNS
jgi:two-component system nitrate/nitrite response regulator NarL